MAEQDYKKRVDAAFTSLEKAREMVRRGTIGPMHPLPDEGVKPIPIAPSKKAALDPGISPTELYQKKVDEAFKQLQEAKRQAEAGTALLLRDRVSPAKGCPRKEGKEAEQDGQTEGPDSATKEL